MAVRSDTTHPVIVERMSKDMLATSRVLDTCDARAFATGDPWDALVVLRSSVEKLVADAEAHRPDVV